MKARPFNFDNFTDLNSINKWRKHHKMSPIKLRELPQIGYVVPGVAMGFLRQIEGGAAIFDSMITNPYVSSQTRHKALDAIYNKILKVPGINNIIGFTTDEGALQRAKSHGFKQLQYTVLAYSKE